MAALLEVIRYLYLKYPHKSELAKARLTKMVYLADWLSCVRRGRQLTSIEWVFHQYGPYVEDVIDAIKSDPKFEVEITTNMHGDVKEQIRQREPIEIPNLEQDEAAILNHVIETTSKMYWDEFMRLVYSTYPILTQPRFGKLDLVSLADEYNHRRQKV